MRALALLALPFVAVLTVAFGKFLYDQWAFISIVFQYSVAGIGGLLVISLGCAIAAGVTTWLDGRAADKAEREAELRRNNTEIVVANPGQQVYINVTDTRIAGYTQSIPLHLSPGVTNAQSVAQPTEDEMRRWAFDEMAYAVKPKQVTQMLGDGADLTAGANKRLTTLVADLMRFGADDAPQMRLVAPAGTGKSTLLHHFVDEVSANVVLFQTHERIYPEDYASYGNRVHVVGMSNQYGNANEYDDANKAACKHILHVAGVVKRRYQKGTRSPMLLIVDEWLDICDWANDHGYEAAVKALKMLSTTKARKAGVGVILATQTATAGSQGFKGSADVFKKMITIELFKTESERYAKVTRPGAEPLLYDLPGPHPIPVRQSQRKDEIAASMPHMSLADELAEAKAADQTSIPDVFDDAFDDDLKAIAPKVAKHAPENVNRIIDEILAGTPDVFPTKSQVTRAVGITGGSKYTEIIRIYDVRRVEWETG